MDEGFDADRRQSVTGEVEPSVMHHRRQVVRHRVVVGRGLLVEVVLFASLDVVREDGDVVVAVVARLLVVQAHGVAELVRHDAQCGAVAADAQVLAAGTGDLPDCRPAAVRSDDVDVRLGGSLGHLGELDAGVVPPVIDAS